jgi:ATP-dependent Clp protease ATP-binding subunit ClpC
MSVYNSVIFKDFNLTPRAKKAYSDAFRLSRKLKHKNVNNLHVLYGCLANNFDKLETFLLNNGFSIENHEVISVIDSCSDQESFSPYFYANSNSDPWHKEVLDSISEANRISQKLDHNYIGIEHILLSVFKNSDYVSEIIKEYVIDYDLFIKSLRDFVCNDIQDEEELKELNFLSDEDFISSISEFHQEDSLAQEPQGLPDFVTPLSAVYESGQLPDVHGREAEVGLLIETISKKNKSNAVLTGEAGVGKTAVVELLVSKISRGEVPSNMFGLEILSVNLGNMIAGTQYRGQFEQKFKTLLDIAKSSPDIILFFDEIHTIFGTGAGGSQDGNLDAANMIKPYLARGDIKCIGATTREEYDKIFKKDGAMKRRFFEIKVEEPSVKETKEILYSCKAKYESFHNVKFSKTTVDCIVDLSHSLISNKKFPDKAFDVIDQVGSRVKIRNSKSSKQANNMHGELVSSLSQGDINEEDVKLKLKSFLKELDSSKTNRGEPIKIKKNDVLEIIAEHAKISIDQVQTGSQNFTSFEKRLNSEVFGQEEVIKDVTDLLFCAKAGLTDPDKPLASFFFVGPTSVGKTHTAKKIAKNFFGNERAIIQINMSELYDKTGISKLIGSNSGYVGYEEGGMLTKFVKENPNCVVLFDEVEKADPQILNILLHLLDEGYIEDSKHEKIDFSKSIVVLTSNIGHKESAKKSMGFIQDEETVSDSYKKSVKKELKPELLARINKVLVFEDLKDSDMKRIINSELAKIKSKLKEKGKDISFSKEVGLFIFNDLKTKSIHARGVKSYVKENVEIPLAKAVVLNSKKSKITVKNIDNKIKVC